MSHGQTIGHGNERPCWQCKHFVALGSGGAACIQGERVHTQATPQSGCVFHEPDPVRPGARPPRAVSFLDAWRMVPAHIERPAEVLALMQTEFRVLVCGGRDYVDREAAFAALDRADRKRKITVVIHGAYRGADTLADEWGKARMREVLPFPADWTRLKKRAGPVRNQQMLDEGKPHAVIQLPGGDGTADMVGRARAAGLPVWAPYRTKQNC